MLMISGLHCMCKTFSFNSLSWEISVILLSVVFSPVPFIDSVQPLSSHSLRKWSCLLINQTNRQFFFIFRWTALISWTCPSITFQSSLRLKSHSATRAFSCRRDWVGAQSSGITFSANLWLKRPIQRLRLQIIALLLFGITAAGKSDQDKSLAVWV